MLKYFISTPASSECLLKVSASLFLSSSWWPGSVSLPPTEALCLPMLLSTFSHYSFFHMAANMYVLWSFSSSAVSMLGREQFMALYLSAGAAHTLPPPHTQSALIWFSNPRSLTFLSVCLGVVSTFVSYVSKVATGRICMSVGAVSDGFFLHQKNICIKPVITDRLGHWSLEHFKVSVNLLNLVSC